MCLSIISSLIVEFAKRGSFTMCKGIHSSSACLALAGFVLGRDGEEVGLGVEVEVGFDVGSK